MSKAQPDRWSGNPSRITSFITLPSPTESGSSDQHYSSPNCGFGWKFDFVRRFQYQVSQSNPDVQERKGRVDVTYRRNLCYGMQFQAVSMTISVEYQGKNGEPGTAVRMDYPSIGISGDYHFGTFEEPFQYQGKAIYEITLTFNPNDHLTFPTSPSYELNHALAASLDGQVLIDTKFYLFSAKLRRGPGRPRAVYGNATLLGSTTPYLKDLLSDSNFEAGVLCGLHEDAQNVVGKLNYEAYHDYDSDSDLESLPDEEDENPWKNPTFRAKAGGPPKSTAEFRAKGKGPSKSPPFHAKVEDPSKGPSLHAEDEDPLKSPSFHAKDEDPLNAPPSHAKGEDPLNGSAFPLGDDLEFEQGLPTTAQNLAVAPDALDPPDKSVPQDPWDQLQLNGPISSMGGANECKVRAYAINGTAYRTWKAFIFYAYTNEIHFEPLKSQGQKIPKPAPPTRTVAPEAKQKITCSPKSMYRLADYAGLSDVKDLAKEGVKGGLSESNIVEELFSPFTSKYDEIIEMEVDFLIQHWTPKVSQDFDDALELVVNGLKPYSHRTLAFTIKRLRNEDKVSAWNSLRSRNTWPSFKSSRPSIAKPSKPVAASGKKGKKKKGKAGLVSDLWGSD